MAAIPTVQPEHVVRFLFPCPAPATPEVPVVSSGPPLSASVLRTVEALLWCANQVRRALSLRCALRKTPCAGGP